jgi:hypothetical protein
VTPILPVTQYNIACCYSMLGQLDEGLRSLEQALNLGFEDFGKCRSDKNLEALRKSPKFNEVMDKYDEPVINWSAVQGTFGALGGLFKRQ